MLLWIFATIYYYSLMFQIYKNWHAMSYYYFLICLVNEANEDHPLPHQVYSHEQAVRNTLNRLMELYHPAPFHCQGYTFPQNPARGHIWHPGGWELFFLSAAGQLQQEMALQWLAEESCGEVITCIEASTGICQSAKILCEKLDWPFMPRDILLCWGVYVKSSWGTTVGETQLRLNWGMPGLMDTFRVSTTIQKFDIVRVHLHVNIHVHTCTWQCNLLRSQCTL